MLFNKVEGCYVLYRTSTGYKESPLYTMKGELFFKNGSAYLKVLQSNLSTSPKISWVNMYRIADGIVTDLKVKFTAFGTHLIPEVKDVEVKGEPRRVRTELDEDDAYMDEKNEE